MFNYVHLWQVWCLHAWIFLVRTEIMIQNLKFVQLCPFMTSTIFACLNISRSDTNNDPKIKFCSIMSIYDKVGCLHAWIFLVRTEIMIQNLNFVQLCSFMTSMMFACLNISRSHRNNDPKFKVCSIMSIYDKYDICMLEYFSFGHK